MIPLMLGVLLLLLAPVRAGTDEYRIHLVQPESAQVASWELQVLKGAWTAIDGSQTILAPSESCLTGSVWLDSPGLVRARAWSEGPEGDVPSAWSHPVPAPEPSVRLGLGLGVMLVAAFAQKRYRSPA